MVRRDCHWRCWWLILVMGVGVGYMGMVGSVGGGGSGMVEGEEGCAVNVQADGSGVEYYNNSLVTYIAAFTFAIIIYRVFFLENKSKLISKVIPGRKLSDPTIRELYNLFTTFFVNEYKTYAVFKDYIKSDVTCLLFYNRQHVLVGFIILNCNDYVLEKKAFNVIQGDFFGLSTEYRNNYIPILTLVKYCFFHRLRHPFIPMYYFFITYSYRSYLSFGRTIGDYWPRHSHPTPPREKKILDFLGKKAAGTWGIYNEESCVIVDRTRGEAGKMALTLSEPRMLTKTIEFFFQLDPGFRSGDCLSVLCKISWMNFVTGLWKVFKRWRLSLSEKSRLARLNSEMNVSPETRKRKESEPHVAIGKAIRQGDQEIHNEEFEEFSITVSTLDKSELSRRLKSSRLTVQCTKDWPHLGVDVDYLNELIDYWQNSYDWSRHESVMNKYPQYRIKINNIFIHFFHVQSSRHDALPLLLLHGFPSSPYEFMKLIPMLTSPEDETAPAFHIICPSLPGCGWSEAPKPQSASQDIATLIGKLMKSIDYTMYAAHGTGWGSLIASQLAIIFPENCVAVHLGTPIPKIYPQSNLLEKVRSYLYWWVPQLFFEKQELRQLLNFDLEEYCLQLDVDGKLLYGLLDSPMALAAFFVERLRNSTDCKGNLESVLTKDELLTHITIYWYTQTIAPAMRLYSNSMDCCKDLPPHKEICVPVAITIFPKQMTLPKQFSNGLYDIPRRWTYMDKGGYFPAWEDPSSLSEDIQSFFLSFVDRKDL